MRLLSKILVFLFVVVVSLPAFAQEWSDSFSGESFPQSVTQARVVVVPASTGDVADAVTAALIQSLRDAGAPEVLDGRGTLGDVTTLDDEEIVSKAQALPVDVVIVARTFGEVDGGQAVVTMYQKSGQAIGGFSAKKGQKIVFEASDQDAKLGISSETVKATQSAIGGMGTAEKQPEESRRRWRVSVEADDRIAAYDREEERRYEGRELWEMMGDEALTEYESNLASREAWTWTGVVVMLTGTAALATGSVLAIEAANRTYPDDDPIFDECNVLSNDRAQQNCRVEVTDETTDPDFETGLILAGAGTGVGIIGIVIYSVASGMDVEPMELREVDERLAGITELPLPTGYDLTPTASGGGQLSLTWKF